MIGNNSCGVHALMGGKTVDNIESLDVLLYDGTRMTLGPMSEDALEAAIAAGGRTGMIYAGLKRLRDAYAALVRERFPDIPRRVSGYNLDQLLPENGFHVARALVGTEATCVTVLEATVRLMKSPQYRQLVVLGFARYLCRGRRCAGDSELQAHRPGRLRRPCWSTSCAASRWRSKTSHCCRKAADSCSSNLAPIPMTARARRRNAS